jgi:hypothetical protein
MLVHRYIFLTCRWSGLIWGPLGWELGVLTIAPWWPKLKYISGNPVYNKNMTLGAIFWQKRQKSRSGVWQINITQNMCALVSYICSNKREYKGNYNSNITKQDYSGGWQINTKQKNYFQLHTLIADVCLRFVYIFGPQTYKMSKRTQTVK